MIEKVLSLIREHHMIEEGEHILVGISGGADSVCLLLILKEICPQFSLKITAVHVEHQIRGAESRQDADFVMEFCKRQEIPCILYSRDAIRFAREHKMSLEEGARELRYACFKDAAQKTGAEKIAVAHNQNDCAETLLFQLCRGSGLKGLCGIAAVRDGIIRPLLGVSREEIEAFLRERNQKYRTDSTNLQVEYSRNKIRHQVLPILSQINSAAVEHIYQSARYIAEASALIEQQVTLVKEKCVKGGLLSLELIGQPIFIQQGVVHGILGEVAGSRKDISAVHIQQVLHLFTLQTGRKISLPYHLEAVRVYEGVLVQRIQEWHEEEEIRLVMPESRIKIPTSDWEIRSRIVEKSGNIPKKVYTKWFDYDKIKDGLVLRRRQAGDYLVIDRQGRKQKLKKYFINEKIPEQEREKIWVLAEGSHILWVIGYRISEAYKVTEQTKRILEIQVDGGESNE